MLGLLASSLVNNRLAGVLIFMLGQDKRPQLGWTRRTEYRPTEIVAATLRLFAELGFAAKKREDVARETQLVRNVLQPPIAFA